MNQAAVAQTTQTGCRVDALNPQPPHLPPTLATVTVGIEQTANESLVTTPPQGAAGSPLSFNHLKDFFMRSTAHVVSFYSGHVYPSLIRQQTPGTVAPGKLFQMLKSHAALCGWISFILAQIRCKSSNTL